MQRFIPQTISEPRRGVFRRREAWLLSLVGALLFWASPSLLRGDIPALLTDKIYQGSGTIDLLKDVTTAELQAYLEQTGEATIGVDLNENLSGNESADSVGVAIKSIELVLTTTEGTMTFTDFYTSTTATIIEQGASAPQEYYTLFGTGGSSSINGGTSDFDPTQLDDVFTIQDISFAGSLLDAQLNITFLDTANTGTEGNETFFDFSNGPEDFALINQAAAQIIQEAAAGQEEAPETVSYTAQSTFAAPGAPSPPLGVLLIMAVVLIWRLKAGA